MSEGFWWIALALLAASALAHLVSMLSTRWGDRAASSKALAFSLLLHIAIACGLFAVAPTIRRMAASQPAAPQSVTVTNIVTDLPTAEEPDSPPTADRPAWDQLQPPPPPGMSRFQREASPTDATEPKRLPQDVAAVARALPAASDLPTLDAPQPAARAAEIPRVATAPAATPDVEQETADARADAARADAARADAAPPLTRTAPVTSALPEPSAERAAPAAPPVMTQNAPPERFAPPVAPSRLLPEPEAAVSNAETLTLRRPATSPELEGPAPIPVADPQTDVVTGVIARPPRRRTRDSDLSGESDLSGDLPEPVREPPALVGSPSLPPERMLASSRPVPLPGRSGLPDIRRPESEPTIDRVAVPELYRQRRREGRREIARANGGTVESEQAVEQSLKYLASMQTPAGYWDAEANGAGKIGIDEAGVDRKFAGKTADAGLTALAVLAFLGAGHTPEEGPYAKNVERAIGWLVAHQRADGFLGNTDAPYEAMYCHGMATYALAEAYGMQAGSGDERLRRPLERAVAYTLGQQLTDGGWRYEKSPTAYGDMSMFGWHLMALKSAEIAGLPKNRTARNGMIRFLKKNSLGTSEGLAAYYSTPNLPGKPTAPMTAEALFCKQMLGLNRDNPMSLSAVLYLRDHLPKRSETNYYYWYYGTLALFQYGGDDWNRWNTALRDLLVAEQVTQGQNAGSWNPNDPWGPYGGRIYSTALATLSLEVYYRFLPLYRDSTEVEP